MKFPLNTYVAIAASVLVGAAAGVIVPRIASVYANDVKSRRAEVEENERHGPTTPRADREVDVLQNVSEEPGFGGFPVEKQKDVLTRLKAKYGRSYPTNVQIMVARMVKGLSLDQASELLESLPVGKQADASTRRLLGERIAASDPQRVIDLGRKVKDEKLVALAVTSVAQHDGPGALGLLAGLTESERKSAVSDMTSPVWSSQFRGTVTDVGDFLRQTPELVAELEKDKLGMGKLLGKVISQSIDNSGESFEKVRAMAAEFAGKNKVEQKNGELQKTVDKFLTGVTDSAYRGLVAQSAEKGSAFLDGVPETQKTSWLLQLDAVSRYRTQGLESAIQFAEKQGGDEFVKMAASGTWVALAQKERESAMSWVESLPEGPFRKGAYMGVLMDAFRYSGSEMGLQQAIDAPVPLSEKSRVGYYEELIQLSRQWGMMWGGPSASEIVERAILSDAQKNELYRRIAPIKAN